MQQFALRAKKAIRKVAAISVGAAMLGATLTGALAQSYTLTDYPAPFVKAGKYDMLPVYGRRSTGDDISAAWDILAGMSAYAVSKTGGGTTVVTGGETDEIPLNTTLTRSGFIDSQLEDDDIESFQDTEISFAGKSVDVHDELDLGEITTTGGSSPTANTGPKMATSLSAGDDDYESNIYMEVPKKRITYNYVFDETINLQNDTSTSQPLELNFLGKKLKIVSIVSQSEFKAYVGDEYFMNVGDKVTCVGKTLSLENVGQSAVLVDVDGVKATIDSGGTETVNGCEITVDELFYRTQIESSSATLVSGKDSSESIKDGDTYFGGDDNCLNNNPDDPDCWKWVVGELRTSGTGNINKGETSNYGPTIGLSNDFTMDDDKDNPPTVGDCVNLPNNYASICVDSLNVADTNYNTFEITFDNSKDLSQGGASGQTSEPVIQIAALEGLDEGLVLDAKDFQDFGPVLTGTASTVKTDKIWLHINDTSSAYVDFFYEDSDNKVKWGGSNVLTSNATHTAIFSKFGEINFDNTKGTNIVLALNQIAGAAPAADDGIGLVFDTLGEEGQPSVNSVDDLKLILKNSSTAFSGLGQTTETSEAAELIWSYNSENRTIGTKDEDHRTMYGIIIRDPDSSLASDTLTLEVPADQVKANIVVKGSSTSVTSASGASAVTDTAPPMVKDSEVSVPENDNLLLVGGPAVNDLTSRFIGSSWTYRPGEAVIELKSNGANVALVVAGTDAVDTRRAGRVLRDFQLYKSRLVGSAVKVSGTSSTFTDTVVQAA